MPDQSLITLDLQVVQTTIIDIVREAGELLCDYYSRPVKMNTKASAVDIVTEADKGIEAFLVREITTQYPKTHIVGEEGGGYGNPIESAQYRWYIDPIDGTTNFANKLPYFCVSVGMTDAAFNPLVGVVFNPITDELYSAVRGQGATLNGEALSVSSKNTISQSVLATGFPYDRATNLDNNTREFSEFIMRSRSTRCLGAAALDLCYVGAGRLDGYWEGHLHPWDCVAGALVALEAGGKITNYAGDDSSSVFEIGQLVATNGNIHQEMLDILQQIREA